MDAISARTITTWRYAPPHDFYNVDPAEQEDSLAGLLNPAFAYQAITDEPGRLVAFACFGDDAQVDGGDYRLPALDLGWGLHPALVGQGLGLPLVLAILDLARGQFAPPAFRATVAAFNMASRRVCEKAGFQQVQTFRHRAPWNARSRDWIVFCRPS